MRKGRGKFFIRKTFIVEKKCLKKILFDVGGGDI